MPFKQKMLERLTGKNATSANRLSDEMGVPQGTLSKWLAEARSLPLMRPRKPKVKDWSVDEKIRVLAKAAKVTGEQLTALLEEEKLSLAELEQWRLALGAGVRTRAVRARSEFEG